MHNNFLGISRRDKIEAKLEGGTNFLSLCVRFSYHIEIDTEKLFQFSEIAVPYRAQRDGKKGLRRNQL